MVWLWVAPMRVPYSDNNITGAILGALLFGLAGAYLGGEYKLLATFIVLVAVLLVRPYGLFGTHEIERL